MVIPIEIIGTDWVGIAAASCSFLVAVAALAAIVHTEKIQRRGENERRQQRKADRQERLLGEIIEWAMSIMRLHSNIKTITPDVWEMEPTQRQRYMAPETKSKMIDFSDRCQAIFNQSKYIKVYATEIDKDLSELVGQAKKLLESLDKDIALCIKEDRAYPTYVTFLNDALV